MRNTKDKATFYGGIWIGASLLTGAAVPFVLWLIFRKICWLPVIIGGLGLAAFFVAFLIGKLRGAGKVPQYVRDLRERIAYDPETQYAVIRSSICTGEKVAGFKNRKNGHFTEVMVIRTPEDEQRFRMIFELDSVKVEY